MMWWWNDGPGPWMYWMPVFFILMVGACVFMMFFMMRGHRGGNRGDSAAQILKERFARGEIDKNEYEERRRLLDA
jgi:putative membrane protein